MKGFAYDSVSANTTQATHAWAVSWQRRNKRYCHCNHDGPSGHRPAEHGNSPRSATTYQHTPRDFCRPKHHTPVGDMEFDTTRFWLILYNRMDTTAEKNLKHHWMQHFTLVTKQKNILCVTTDRPCNITRKNQTPWKIPMFHQHLRKTVITFQSRSLPKLLCPTKDACTTCGRHDTQHPDAKDATALVYIVTFSTHKLSLWRT